MSDPSRGIAMSEEEYTALDAIRASTVKTLARSTLAHLRVDLSRPREDTDAFRVGRALHCAVLRPSDFAEEFAITPKCDRRTKAGREGHEAACVAAEGRTLLAESDAHIVDSMTRSIRAHASASRALDLCTVRERVFLGEISGEKCKCRVDAAERGILLDLKTTISAAPHAFSRSVAEYGYALQFAFYRAILRQHGYTIDDCMIVAIEKSAPYAVACFRLRDEDLERADAVVRRLVGEIGDAQRTGVWSGYSPDVVDIALPDWAFRSEGME